MSLITRLLTTFIAFFAGSATLFAAGGHDHLPAHAEKITPDSFPFAITNSMVAVWLAAAVVIFLAQASTRKMALVPQGVQNLFEWLVESLYTFLEGILGSHLVKRTFWFFATIFILILISNWMGLLPGVGTIGWKLSGAGVDSHDQFRPFLRGANADLNMTLGMSLTFAILWFYWAISENGLKGFLAHIFAPKGKFKGPMLALMVLVFGFVGIIEVASILLRPVALSFRLYGNIFAGENILENMMLNKSIWIAWLPPLPFYFLELLVGLIQALVFMLLTSVFLKLICEHDHDDEHHEEEATH